MKLTENDIKRFWSKVDKTGDCWEWTGCKRNRYGAFQISGKSNYAHRIAWFLTNGPIPSGMFVLHVCDNTNCVNPMHLFIGTHTDNMQDMIKKGRANNLRGEDIGTAKLIKEQVLDIREKYIPFKYSLSRLSGEYRVTRQAIYRIIHRQTWAHI